MSTILKALRRLENDDAKKKPGAAATPRGSAPPNTPASAPFPPSDPRAADALRNRILGEEAAARVGTSPSAESALRPRRSLLRIGAAAAVLVAGLAYALMNPNTLATLFERPVTSGDPDAASVRNANPESQNASAPSPTAARRSPPTQPSAPPPRAMVAVPSPLAETTPPAIAPNTPPPAPSAAPPVVQPVASSPPTELRTAALPQPSSPGPTPASPPAPEPQQTARVASSRALPNNETDGPPVDQSASSASSAPKPTEAPPRANPAPRIAASPVPEAAPPIAAVSAPAPVQSAAVKPVPDSAPRKAPATPSAPTPEPKTAAPARESRVATTPAAAAPTLPAAPSPTVQRVAPGGLPEVYVVRTAWHPKPERRSAKVRIAETNELVTVHEGDTVAGLALREITPSAVVFSAGEIEIRRRVGDDPGSS